MNLSVCVFKPRGRKYFYAQWTDPVTGRKKTRSTGTDRKRQAERVAGQIERQLRDGTFCGRRVSWAEFRRRYDTEVLTGLAASTRVKANVVLDMLGQIIAPKYLNSLGAGQVSEFVRVLRTRGRSEATIKGYLGQIKAALRWGHRQKLLATVPSIDMPKRAPTMRGRPVTGEEFERMLAKVPAVVGRAQAASWRFFLLGLWWSGLRRSEAMQLRWSGGPLTVDLTGRYPMLRIQAEGQKSHKAQLLPLAPEFAELLLSVPEAERRGFVFNPAPLRPYPGRLTAAQAGRIVSRVASRAAGVKVGERNGRACYAGCHDLRRSFGTRWAQRVRAPVLQQLMRHASIQTTLQYYVREDSEAVSDALWRAFANSLANTPDHPAWEAYDADCRNPSLAQEKGQ